jgi:hypothetical protein
MNGIYTLYIWYIIAETIKNSFMISYHECHERIFVDFVVIDYMYNECMNGYCWLSITFI